MENKYIQQMLQAGLIDIGDNDERLENIEKSIADLTEKLKTDQSLLPRYTLVGLDPNINEDEPILEDVEAIIASHWKALRAKFSEKPLPILRSVILHSLFNVGIADPILARIIYLSASNFYPFAKLKREKNTIENMLTELGDLAEKNAVEVWSIDHKEMEIKISTLKIKGLTFSPLSLDKNKLKRDLKIAISNNPTTNHGSNHGGTSSWGDHFSSKAGDAISEAFTKATEDLNSSLSVTGIEEPINKFFVEFKKILSQSLKESFSSIQAVERRSKLLWWKETLYSSTLKDSYRSINETLQVIILAKDLYQQLPSVTPVSVDYLLRDTLLLVNDGATKKTTFKNFLSEITKEANKVILKEYFEVTEEPNHRITFTEFIGLALHDKVHSNSFENYTGIEDKSSTSLADISVMLLHDWMAEYLIPTED